MATKTLDISETYLSRDKADQWGRGRQRRDAAFGPATETMLELIGLRVGDRVLDVAASKYQTESLRTHVHFNTE